MSSHVTTYTDWSEYSNYSIGYHVFCAPRFAQNHKAYFHQGVYPAYYAGKNSVGMTLYDWHIDTSGSDTPYRVECLDFGG